MSGWADEWECSSLRQNKFNIRTSLVKLLTLATVVKETVLLLKVAQSDLLALSQVGHGGRPAAETARELFLIQSVALFQPQQSN